jgi:hypothetical protein
MILLLVPLLLQEADYDARLRELTDAVVAERTKAAEACEKMRATDWARAEYRKILRADPNDALAKRKLEGAEALPAQKEKPDATAAERYHQLMGAIAKVAADRHASLARWCDEQKKTAAAARHWELALMFEPGHEDAIAALGLSGRGAAAVDAIWKDAKFVEILRKADEGKESKDATDLEGKWKGKHAKRVGPTFAWEGVDVSTEHLKALSRQAEAVAWFMRTLLGDEKAAPCVKKLVIMTGKEPYHRYIDDFIEAPPETIKLLKKTGGTQHIKREEFVQFAWTKGANWHDHVVAHSVAEFFLAPAVGQQDYDAPPAWFKEGVGCFVEHLFRGTVKASCVNIPSGTGTGDVPWDDSSNWDSNLKGQVNRGRDPALVDVISVTLNAITGAQRAKAASVVKFLAMRRPGWFRDVVAAYKKGAKDPRAALESALGLSLDEVDEFWRRWIRGQ